MVIAISMQKLDTQYAGLADSYYLAALPFFDAVMKRMDVGTLQCCALIAQYSMVTPTRTASYWIIGFAMKLCLKLRLHEERAIDRDSNGALLNPLEVDMRRRMFWIITSMEFGLSHSLGRPAALSAAIDQIDVGFFEQADDINITPDGVIPGSQPIMKKRLAIHFFKMRLLQAEIRRKLYLRKRDEPRDDTHPWFGEMRAKLDNWLESCPKQDEGSGLTTIWLVICVSLQLLLADILYGAWTAFHWTRL